VWPPPRGSDPPMWPLPAGSLRWTFMWGKSDSVDPPTGSNPKVWPPWGIRSYDVAPPGDQTFRCGPAVGLTATPWDHSNILWEPAAAFKGTIYEECVYGVAILYKNYKHSGFLAWRKKPIPQGGPHWGIDYKLEYFSKFKFIFKTALGYESGG
jgi:hypothetical protein